MKEKPKSMPLNPIPLSRGALEIFNVLDELGIEGYVIGGCVRDFLLHQSIGDYDFAVAAPPARIKEIFAQKGLRVFDKAQRFGTIGVMASGEVFEITSFRSESRYEAFRKPKFVRFGCSLKEDVKRRDFTINALAYHPSCGIVDLCGGLQDLEDRILRCIGDPSERFGEDAIRILRAVNFHLKLGFVIEERTLSSMLSQAALLRHISKERVSMEFRKILLNAKKLRSLLSFEAVLDAVFLEGFSHYLRQKIHHHKDELLGDFTTRAALVFEGWEAWRECLRLSREQQVLIDLKREWISSIRRQDTAGIKAGLKQMLRGSKISKEIALAAMMECVQLLGRESQKRALDEIIQNQEAYCLKDLKLCGRDLAAMEIHGRECGKILEKLLDEVIEGRCANEASALLARASEFKT